MSEAYADIFAELIINRTISRHPIWGSNWNDTHRGIVYNDILAFAGEGSRATQRAANFLGIELSQQAG